MIDEYDDEDDEPIPTGLKVFVLVALCLLAMNAGFHAHKLMGF